MRKTLQPALLALCCALLYVTAGVAEEAVEFKPVWPVGKRFTFIDRQVMEQTFSIPNVPEPMQQKMSQTQKYSYSVLRETPGGDNERLSEAVQQLHDEVAELQERVDFTERLLSEVRSKNAIGPGDSP